MEYWNAGVMGFGLYTLDSTLQLSSTPTDPTLIFYGSIW